MVSCTVLASFVQYVPSILAVIKFKHNDEYPTHGFSLPGKYTIPIIALIISCYMITNFTVPTLLLGTVVAVIAAACYFIKEDKVAEEKHESFLARLRNKAFDKTKK